MMKHYGSKLLALLLCMITVLGMMPMTVSADSGTAVASGQLTVVNAGFEEASADHGRVGNPPDIANMVLYLCSDMAGFITGENICIDGGMTRQMIYHGDCGWRVDEN